MFFLSSYQFSFAHRQEFVKDALGVRLLGMNADLMCRYIRFVADKLLVALGCEPLYKVDNPFDWMELISLCGKTNFFERRVGEYAKAGVKDQSGDALAAKTSNSSQRTFNMHASGW